MLSRTPDADDPPYESEGVVSGLCPSQFSFEILTREGRRHWPSSICLSLSDPWSRVVQLHSQRTIDSFVGRRQSCGPNWIVLQQVFNPPPACFAVSLLSPLASSHESASRATFTETPLFEVFSAEIGPRHYVLHQHLSWGLGAPFPRVSPFRLECRMPCYCHPETMEKLVFRVFSPRPISPAQVS